jgi:5-hydroxyisourate hydrolase-like protein (transthyretin family)
MTLNGTVNANGLTTTAWFEYGTIDGSYSGTSSTQTVLGMENTIVRMEINVEACINHYNWCTGETTYIGPTYYYYRIAAQNSAGISYGDQKGVENLCIAGDSWDCTPTPVTSPTPVLVGSINGEVVDALTGNPIARVTVTINPGGSTATTDENGEFLIQYLTVGDYLLTVTATGYEIATKSFAIEEGQFVTINFAMLPLLPLPTPDVSPNVSPTPCAEVNSVEVDSRKITIKRNTNSGMTITVLCDNGSPVEGVMVSASINKAGNKRILILSESTNTNENGEAKFTIIAKNKTGNARVTFQAGGLKKSVIVKVRR